jgi:hypothetical protein
MDAVAGINQISLLRNQVADLDESGTPLSSRFHKPSYPSCGDRLTRLSSIPLMMVALPHVSIPTG